VVDPPAVLPDLAVSPGERRDVAHLDHGLREVLEEDVLVGGVELDEVAGGGAAREEHLIGGKQAAVGEDVLVVLVVELEGRDGVEEEEVLVAPRARAARAQRRRVGHVQGQVREAVARLVVEALAEARAPGVADGVATCHHQSPCHVLLLH
jgi:hypothetical protein